MTGNIALDITKLAFGGVEAENDELLDRAFLSTITYERAIDGEVMYVIGRKGSGKSAIYTEIEKNVEKRTRIHALTFDDYPWKAHEELEDAKPPTEDKYKYLWKYIIFIALIKDLIIENNKLKIWSSKNKRNLRRYLKNNYGTYNPNLLELFIDKAKRIKFNLQLIGSGAGFEYKEEVPPKNILTNNINIFVNESGNRVLKLLKRGIKHYILFDKLDTGWTGDENSRQNLIGLLKAAREINIQARNQNKSIRVIIFLRSDIYNELRYEDKSKAADDIEFIFWTEDTLKELIEKRIKVSMGDDSLTFEDITSDEYIERRQKAWSYIIKRTLLRPRDVISYCKELKKAYYKRVEGQIPGAGSRRIIKEDVKEAEKEHSKRLYSEFIDENFKTFPELETVFKGIQTIGYESFNESDMRLAISNVNPDIEFEITRKKLFELGILGHYIRGGPVESRGKTFNYMDDNLFLDTGKPYYIHPGLTKKLRLTERRS